MRTHPATIARKEGKATVRIEFRMHHLSDASRAEAKRIYGTGLTSLGLCRSITVLDACEVESLNAAIDKAMKKISAQRARTADFVRVHGTQFPTTRT